MKIVSKDYCPNSTYFSMSDVAPELRENGLIICNGHGSSRSWGRPETTSTVVFKGQSLIAIHVSFHHKHRGGQGWHYFRKGETWEKVTWGRLVDSDRKKVLARKAKAPAWAKSPGKLRTERCTPTANTRIGYKLVARRNGVLMSLYDPACTYKIGQRMTEKVRADHNGGYYFFTTPQEADRVEVLRKWMPDDAKEIWDKPDTEFTILECECGGRVISYPNGKFACTYLTPRRIVATTL